MADEEEIPLHIMSSSGSRKIILKKQISCFVPLNNYSTTVGIPSYYTERKHEEYGTWKYFLRKIACIPLALIYGIFIVWVVSEFILNKPSQSVTSSSITTNDTPKNICSIIMESYNETVNTTRNDESRYLKNTYGIRLASEIIKVEEKAPVTNVSHTNMSYLKSDVPLHSNTSARPSKQSIIFENDSPELYGVTSAVVCVIAFTSFFSRNTRGTMLLILPGLITKHSRKLIFTLILGLLVNGPINTLRYNFHVALHNTGCMHKSVTIAACIKEREIDQLKAQARIIYKSMLKMDKILADLFCVRGRDLFGRKCDKNDVTSTVAPFSTMFRIQDLMAMTEPSWSELKEQGTIIMEKLGKIGRCVDIIRKCLTVITILILIFDAIAYLRSYYTDSSFDNKVIDQSIQKSWRSKNYRALAPLRHWEINKGYKEKKFTKFTRKELFKVLRNGMATFIFFIFVAGVFITDWLLADALQYIKDNPNFRIEIKGMNQNFTDYINQLHGSVMKSCLTSPRHPSMDIYYLIGLLLAAAATSCLLEIYMTRTRAQICNLFYPDRAEERADYLHFAISSGRVDRRHNLLLIIRREIERKIRLIRFSPFQRFINFIWQFCKCTRYIECPGCGWRVRNYKPVSFSVEDKEIQTKICLECDHVLAERAERESKMLTVENEYM